MFAEISAELLLRSDGGTAPVGNVLLDAAIPAVCRDLVAGARCRRRIRLVGIAQIFDRSGDTNFQRTVFPQLNLGVDALLRGRTLACGALLQLRGYGDGHQRVRQIDITGYAPFDLAFGPPASDILLAKAARRHGV